MQNPYSSDPSAGANALADGVATLDVPGALGIQLVADARGIVVILDGELDLETAPELDRKLGQIDETHVTRILIDLSGVTFMDSTGLASIIRALNFAQSNGHSLVLRRGSNQVQRLFTLTGVNERLTFENH
jgi:anti-sigma B factor antagonist